jgi:hypothetical protein
MAALDVERWLEERHSAVGRHRQPE